MICSNESDPKFSFSAKRSKRKPVQAFIAIYLWPFPNKKMNKSDQRKGTMKFFIEKIGSFVLISILPQSAAVSPCLSAHISSLSIDVTGTQYFCACFCCAVTINFLSIFGASSPMPSSYCEMVLNSMDENRLLYDFLNIFNHNIEKFVYPVWERNRYYAQYQRDLSDKFSKYVLSFLGLYSYSTKKTDTLNLQKLSFI